MKFDEADSELLKNWIVLKLEKSSSDADADVLADYVLALVTTDEPEAIARANCVENLKDFLNDKAEAFVSELFTAIATRSYDPSQPQPKPAKPTFQPPVLSQGKKRRLYGEDHADAGAQVSNATNRPVKQARRGARGGRGRGNFLGQPPIVPPSLPGMPAWDPTNPMASFMAMASAMAAAMVPGGMPVVPPTQSNTRERCRDYDRKGFCTRGAQCPYEHGSDAYVVPEDDQPVEWDMDNELLTGLMPTKAGMLAYSPLDWSGQNKQTSPASKKSKGRRNKRSDFSLVGPNHDQSITTIVVEQIPQDKFDEQIIRDFFGEFGTIEEVTMMEYKRLAIVKYDSFKSAHAAYNSPKSVFDNRFVKVYWYSSPDCLPQPPMNDIEDDVDMEDEEPEIDIEEVKKRQEEAQRKHEQRQKVLEEARQRRQEIGAKIRELDEKRRQLADDLARKQGKPVESEKTRQLREQLAKLEEEAKTLGIDPDSVQIGSSDWSSAPYYPRGRGGYRGRGRGRGGRGGWAAAAKGGAVMRLDNRPKTLCVAFTQGTYDDHHESLRSWLMFNSALDATLGRHPDRTDAALITFEERYQCEIFTSHTNTTDFPLHGKVELSWYTGAPVTDDMQHDIHMKSEHVTSSVVEVDERVDYDETQDDDHWIT